MCRVDLTDKKADVSGAYRMIRLTVGSSTEMRKKSSRGYVPNSNDAMAGFQRNPSADS